MIEEKVFYAAKRLLLTTQQQQSPTPSVTEALDAVLSAIAAHQALAADVKPLLLEVLRTAHANLGKAPGGTTSQAALTAGVVAAFPDLTAAHLAPLPLSPSTPLPASFTPSPADAVDLTLARDVRPTCDAAAARRLTDFLTDAALATVAPPSHFNVIEAARKDLMKLLEKHASAASTDVFGSSRSGLCGPASDADITFLIPALQLDALLVQLAADAGHHTMQVRCRR